ncbi:hypothetical protein VTJ04DRAFT_10458 [Mycothermus thermophilus]|uniref:uncharacterized protein n=1 Tax=Humicola insolens TaxID=85995 RepID=UPI003742CB73
MKSLLLLLSSVALVTSAPSEPHAHHHVFRPEPRSSHLDWNKPRGDGNFLAKRSNLHSEAFFNNPPLLRREAIPSPLPNDTSTPLSVRATAGRWDNLSGNGMWHPAPVSWGGKHQEIYYASKDRTCKYKTYQNNAWTTPGWTDLGGSLDSAPAACSRKTNNVHVFCKGTDGQGWHRSYENGAWGRWQAMGGDVKHYPSACSWGGGHVDAYYSSGDNQCWHRKYDEGKGGWQGWENLGGYLDGPPKAVSWGSGHTSVFCKGDDGQAWHRKYENDAWGDWEPLGGTLDAEPAAWAWDNGRMDVFVKGTDGACWHKTYKKGSGWGGWSNLGGKIKKGKAPDVVIYLTKIEVYIVGEDNAVYRRKYENNQWSSGWENMGGNVDTKPAPVVWDNDKIDIYGGHADGSCRRCY